MLKLTVKEKLVLHLNDYSKSQGAYSHPGEVTQAGIASVLGKDRAVIAQALKELGDGGKVTVLRGKVSGARSAMKCYLLTQGGLDDASRLEGLLRDVSVERDGRLISGVEAQRNYMTSGIRRGVATISILEGERPEPAVAMPRVEELELFVGREDEVKEVAGAKGVLVVLGIGGMGKTSLVRRALASRVHAFLEWRDEISMKGVLSNLAHAIYKSEGVAIEPSLERMSHALEKRRLKLPVVLDNYTRSTQLDTLLRAIAGGGSTLVVTSRERPAFYSMGDLKTGKVGELYLRELSLDESKKLLVLLGRDSTDVDAIAKGACGYPLVLKLAAKSKSALPKQDVMELVHVVVSDLLTEGERGLLKRCSMITDVLYPDVLADTGIWSYYDLFEFKRKCVLTRESDGYRLHEVLRELLRDESSHAWAAKYYAAVGTTEMAFKALYHSAYGDAKTLVRVLEAHTSRLIEKGYASDIYLLLDGASKEGRFAGCERGQLDRVEVALAQCEFVLGRRSAIERLRRLDPGRMEPRLRSDCLRTIALCRFNFEGKLKEAMQALRDAASACDRSDRSLDDCRASAYVNMLSVLSEAGEGDEMLSTYDECVDLLKRAGEWYQSRGENNLGVYYARTGESKKAEEHLKRGIEAAERFNDIRFIANAKVALGHVLIAKGMLGEAESVTRSAVEALAKCNDAFGWASARQNLGRVLIKKGKVTEGVREYEGATETFERSGSLEQAIECRLDMISDLFGHGEAALASRLCADLERTLKSYTGDDAKRFRSALDGLQGDIVAARSQKRRKR